MKKKFNLKSDPDLTKVAPRLIMLREASGLTRGATAGKLGLSRSNLKKIEEGKGCPSLPTMITFCRHFNISSDAILFGERRFPDGVREELVDYTPENKSAVTVPTEKMIDPLNLLRKAWERGDENQKGWIVVELENLARRAAQNL